MFTLKQQELNFRSFYSAYVTPMYALLAHDNNPRQSGPLALFAKAALLESIGWVSLGCVVGHFAETEAALLREGFRINMVGRDEFYADWAHILDSNWQRLFESTSPVSGLRLENPDYQTDIEIFNKVFNAYFARWLYMSRSATATEATAALSFAPSHDIEKGLATKVNIEEIAEALASEPDLSEIPVRLSFGSIYGGYGQLVDFLESFQMLNNRFLNIYGGRMEGITRKVAQLLRWRLFFFEGQTPLFYSFSDRYLDALGVVDVESRKQFRLRVKTLAKTWASMQNSVAAVAGA